MGWTGRTIRRGIQYGIPAFDVRIIYMYLERGYTAVVKALLLAPTLPRVICIQLIRLVNPYGIPETYSSSNPTSYHVGSPCPQPTVTLLMALANPK